MASIDKENQPQVLGAQPPKSQALRTPQGKGLSVRDMNSAEKPQTGVKKPLMAPSPSMNATVAKGPRVPSQNYQDELKSYLTSRQGSSSRPQSIQLAEGIVKDCTSPTPWRKFLAFEEEQGVPQASLVRIFEWATRTIPRAGNSKNTDYLWIWLQYARQQGRESEEDARDTFKYLKAQRIGEDRAELYYAWAAFEITARNYEKAALITRKGQEKGAEPAALLIKLADKLSIALQKQAQGDKEANVPAEPSRTPQHTMRKPSLIRTTQTPQQGTLSGRTSANQLRTPQQPPALTPAGASRIGHGSAVPQSASQIPSKARQSPMITASTVGRPPLHSRTQHSEDELRAPSSRVKAPPSLSRTESVYTVSRITPIKEKSPPFELSDSDHARSVAGSDRSNSSGRESTCTSLTASTHDSDQTFHTQSSKSVEGDTDPHVGLRSVVGRTEDPTVAFTRSNNEAPSNNAPQPNPMETISLNNVRFAPGDSNNPVGLTSILKRPQRQPRRLGSLLSAGPARRIAHSPRVNSEPRKSEEGSDSPLSGEKRQRNRSALESHFDSLSLQGSSKRAMLDEEQVPSAPQPSQEHVKRSQDELRSSKELNPQAAVVQESESTRDAPQPAAESKPMEPAHKSSGAEVKKELPVAPIVQPSTVPDEGPVEDENTVRVHGIRYTKLECVGKGGSSKVFKVISPTRKIYALKRIKLQGCDQQSTEGYIDEINLLKIFQGHEHIIQLIDAEVVEQEKVIYVILEYGEIDLAKLLSKREKQGERLDENHLRLYWQQMLEAVDCVHKERIVHSDLKPANFLSVEGRLRLIDFGIAKAISNDTTSIVREGQVGTLNYMSPEAILGGSKNGPDGKPIKVGRPSDIWSLGCILYQMVYGKTPFAHLQFIQKIHTITDPNHHIEYPPLDNPHIISTMKSCLVHDPKIRATIPQLLSDTFLRPPSVAVAPPDSGAPSQLDPQQLQCLLQNFAAANGRSGGSAEELSKQILEMLQGNKTDLSGLVQNTGAPPPPPPPPPSAAHAPPPPPPPARPRAPLAGAAPTIAPADILAARGQLKNANAGRQVHEGERADAPENSQASALAQAAAAQAQARQQRQLLEGPMPSPRVQRMTHMSNLASELKNGIAALKKVDMAEQEQRRKDNPSGERGLQSVLREGIAKLQIRPEEEDADTCDQTW